MRVKEVILQKKISSLCSIPSERESLGGCKNAAYDLGIFRKKFGVTAEEAIFRVSLLVCDTCEILGFFLFFFF